MKKFPEEYQSQVDSGDLKQSELEEKIRQVNQLIAQVEEIDRFFNSSTMPEGLKFLQKAASSKLMSIYGGTKQKLEKQLEKLLLFNSRSASIFSDIESLEVAVTQGLAQTTTAFNVSTGTFTLSSKENLAWRKTITDKWGDYLERHTVEDEVEIKKVQLQNGEIVYMVYRNGEYDKKATSELAKEIGKDDLQTILSFLSGAGYQVLDNNGVKALLDGIFGEREVRESLQTHKGYNEGVFVGNLLGVIQAGAEYIGGGMWLFSGNLGSLALSPVTGGGSLAAMPVVTAEALGIFGHATAVGGSSINNIMSGDNYNNREIKTVDDILEDAKDTTNAKGKAKNYEKKGGMDQALKDYESLNPKPSKPIDTKYGEGFFGVLEDGTTISVRPGSETGGPTLEIRVPGQALKKVRY